MNDLTYFRLEVCAFRKVMGVKESWTGERGHRLVDKALEDLHMSYMFMVGSDDEIATAAELLLSAQDELAMRDFFNG